MRFRPPALVTLGLLVIAIGVLLSLGSWQLLRERESRRAEDRREARVAAEPLAFDAGAPPSAQAADFRRVRASGRWDYERTMLLANRIRFDTKGEEVVTPLVVDGGGPAVLVNRGWYPLERKAEVLAALAAEPSATVEGLARYVEDAGGHRTQAGTWSRLDVAAMSRALPYAVVPWHLVQGEREASARRAPGPLPDQHYAVIGEDVPHLDYAVTWFGLAAALIATAWIRLRPRRTRRAERPPALPPRAAGSGGSTTG